MESVTCVVVGAGHAGLAASHFLTARSIDHVVLERGDVANSWRTERWDSLRLLTPNWQTRLPGQSYDGADPDGYMSALDVARFVGRFASESGTPVRTNTAVISVRQVDGGYRVVTDGGEIRCRTVVLATGACNAPAVSPLAAALPDAIHQVTAFSYRGPDDLPDGGVLVVGGSATGVQLADEINRSGRPVMLSTGEHVRLPRTYRGRDVLWWMDASGVWDQRYDEVDDVLRARRLPSPQLVGTPERRTLDLNALTEAGVEVVGRLAAVRHSVALFSGGLRNVTGLADLKLNRLLDTFDAWALATGIDGEVGSDGVSGVERPAPTQVARRPRLDLDLTSGQVRTIVWATGYRPEYGWLDVPVLDEKNRLRHDGGVTPCAGLYALGLPVLRRRKSTFIHGIEDDAREVIAELSSYLARSPAPG